MSTLASRLLKSTGANGLSLTVRIAEQLLLVPVLLVAWSADGYGEWMMISALPAYLALSDMGFITAGSNELARRASLGDEKGLRAFYGRYGALCMLWGLGFWFVLFILVQLFPIESFLNLSLISGTEADTVFLILAAGGLISQNSLALLAGLRARQRYHHGLLIRAASAFGRLVAVAVAVLWFEAAPVGVAVIIALGTLAGYLVEGTMVRATGLRPLWRSLANRAVPIRPYMLMGLEFMLMPLATILMLQGMVILIGNTLGAVAVAIYATHRTLTRLVSSLLQIVSHPLTAEAGLLQRPEDLPELRGMVVLVSRITLWLSLGVIAALMLVGPWLIPFWTRGTIPFAPWLFLFLLLATLGEAVWRALSAPRLGSNRHRPLAWGGLALSLSGLVLAWFLTGILGLEGAGLAAAMLEAGMGLLVAATTLPLLGLSWQGYFAALMRPPMAEVCRTGAAIMKRIRP